MNEDRELDESAGASEAIDTKDEPVEGASASGLVTDLAGIPSFTSDAELTFEEALMLAPRRGVRLVLPMGEVRTGKTTIMVEIWTHLVGIKQIAGYRCAGSRTAIALEERAFLSRMAAGVNEPKTPRTQIDENEGLLHIRVARPDGQRVELLLADFSGERFRHIREGTPLLKELPWVQRADRLMILVDGSSFSAGGAREVALNHAMRQVYAIREANVLHPQARIAVVVAKNDQVDDEDFSAAESRIAALTNAARGLDPQAKLFRVAARPADGSPPGGLDDLLDFICDDDREGLLDPVSVSSPSRSIARFRNAL